MKLVKEYQSRLEGIWRLARWTTDVISYARDKSTKGTYNPFRCL